MTATARIRLPDDAPGQRLYRLDVVATMVFVAAAIAATALPSVFRIPYAVVSCILFAAGCVAFLWAYGRALGRSRTESISVAGIYGLAASSPKAVRARFHLLTAVQTLVAVIAAALRPFTAMAFGILVPMLGLALGGLWAASHGRFDLRADRQRSRPQPRASTPHDST